MRRLWSAGCALLLCAGGASGQEPDRHQERRDWLAQRRAGELQDTLPMYTRGVDRTSAGLSSSGPRRDPGFVPIPEERLPHRFEGRYRPNYEASPLHDRYWPLEPLSPYRRPWSGLYGGSGGGYGYGAAPYGGGGYGGVPYGGGYGGVPYGLPYAPWLDTPVPLPLPLASACARVTLQFESSGAVTLFLFLPRTAPFDGRELELMLDRQLSAGRPLVLQDEYGAWVRVHPSARLEGIRIGGCR